MTSLWTWMRKNLLASPRDAALTLAFGSVLIWLGSAVLNWAVFEATFTGQGREACVIAAQSGRDGACWLFVRERLSSFIYGFYPNAERWRVNLTGLLFAAGALPLFIRRTSRWRLPLAVVMLVVFPIVAGVLLHGGILGLTEVETSQWGGLMLTLVIAVVGIAASLPIGVMLALGRRSPLPIISKLSVVFIEFWRGVPLITVLFMASVMLPLFLPPGVSFDKLLRVLVGVTLFASAYMAEVVRGGLQAIPTGQYEAASALGLGYWRMHALIVLPQALRKVVPGIVNTFIGLFKDTTLVLIVGMFDLLGMVQTTLTDPEWLGYSIEGYVFVGVVFWLFCFAMSRYSQKLEAPERLSEKWGVH